MFIMNTLIVFVPSFLYNDDAGFLCGKIDTSEVERSKTFYVLTKVSSATKSSLTELDIIGYYCQSDAGDFSIDLGRKDWIVVSLLSHEFKLRKIMSNGISVNIGSLSCRPTCHTICIVYDQNKFLFSELLLCSKQSVSPYRDHFKALTHYLKSEKSSVKGGTLPSTLSYVILQLISIMLIAVNFLLNTSDYLQPVLKYSRLGSHIHAFLESLSWALDSTLKTKRLTLKVGNYLVATIVDVYSGLLVLHWMMTLVTDTSSSSLQTLLLNTAEVVVATLGNLLQWLMGNPAGLKLNFALSKMLGQFFLYHINLWWTFLVVTKPLLEFMFEIFLCFGSIGLTFQASILDDLLSLCSFHVYCIYVYAARLFNLQVTGLIALWRLFLGKKRNPLRNRIDSCCYSTDQLFVGTLAFTILLFLLPTTLLYYTVFTTLRLLMVALGGVLTQVCFIIRVLPLYVTFLWLCGSTAISSTVHVTVRSSELPNSLNLAVQPIAETWWTTVQRCIPDPIRPPQSVEWKHLLKHLVTGQLIYPV